MDTLHSKQSSQYLSFDDFLADVNSVDAPRAEYQSGQSIDVITVFDEYLDKRNRGEVTDIVAYCQEIPESIRSSAAQLIWAEEYIDFRDEAGPQAPPAPMPEVGEFYFGFNLLEILGEGTYGRVFLATEPGMSDRKVVVKVARNNGEREVDIGAKLNHPNVMGMYSRQYDEERNFTILCMPFHGRATLEHVRRFVFEHNHTIPQSADSFWQALKAKCDDPYEVKMPKDQRYNDVVRNVFRQIADCLGYIHKQGVFHRDLKTSNVLITPKGVPMLMDFNLSTDTKHNNYLPGGTIEYMPPEQLDTMKVENYAQPQRITHKTDVFSYGAMLYEMLTGRLPFGVVPTGLSSMDAVKYLFDKQQAGFEPIRKLCPHVDPELAHLAEQCLALDPNDRPKNAAEISRRLQPKPMAPAKRIMKWMRCHPLGTALLAVLLVVALTGASFVRFREKNSQLRELNPTAIKKGRIAFEKGRKALQRRDFPAAENAFSIAFKNLSDAKSLLARARTREEWAYTLPTDAPRRRQLLQQAQGDYEGVCRTTNDGLSKACLAYFHQRGVGVERDAVATLYYQQALARNYKTVAVYNNLARMQRKRNQLDKALENINTALQKQPKCAAALYNRSVIYMQMFQHASRPSGDQTKCLPYINQALTDILPLVRKKDASMPVLTQAVRVVGYATELDNTYVKDALEVLAQAADGGVPLQQYLQGREWNNLRNDPRVQALLNRQARRQAARGFASMLDPMPKSAIQ